MEFVIIDIIAGIFLILGVFEIRRYFLYRHKDLDLDGRLMEDGRLEVKMQDVNGGKRSHDIYHLLTGIGLIVVSLAVWLPTLAYQVAINILCTGLFIAVLVYGLLNIMDGLRTEVRDKTLNIRLGRGMQTSQYRVWVEKRKYVKQRDYFMVALGIFVILFDLFMLLSSYPVVISK